MDCKLVGSCMDCSQREDVCDWLGSQAGQASWQARRAVEGERERLAAIRDWILVPQRAGNTFLGR